MSDYSYLEVSEILRVSEALGGGVGCFAGCGKVNYEKV